MMPATPSAPRHSTPPPAKLSILSKIAYLLGARWFQEALQTFFFIYLARVSTATYGEFMMALGLGSILLMVAEFGLNLPFVSLTAGSREKVNEVFSQVLILKAVFFILALTGALVFIGWQDYAPPLRRLLLLIGAGVALEALASTFFVVMQVEGRQDQEAKIRTAAAALGFGYGLLALFFGAPPLVIAVFKLIDSIIKLMGGAWLLVWQRQFQWFWPTLRKLKALTRLGLVFAVMEITASIYNKANLFFLQKYGGAEAVGQYSAAWQLVDGFSCLVSGLILQNVLYPMFVRLWNQDRQAVIPLAQNTARWLLILALPLMFFLWAESDRLIPLIYGKSYTQAIWLQQYLVITIIIAFWHNLAVFLLLSMGKEKLLLGFDLLGLMINLLWCSLALPLFPLLGAALAMIITKGAVSILTVTTAQYRLNFLASRDLQQVAGAALVGVIIFFTAKNLVPREVVVFLTLMPFFILGGKWWRAKARTVHNS
jgi:O-antigen/teichoic acid export membrane protein